MLSLLGAFGTLVSWEPLAAFGRSVAVFSTTQEATRVKRALDRVVLESEGDQEGDAVRRADDGCVGANRLCSPRVLCE